MTTAVNHPAPVAAFDAGGGDEQYRNLFEHLLTGMIVLEVIHDASGQPVDHRLIQANAEFERQTGLSRDEELGKTSAELSFSWPDAVRHQYYAIAANGGNLHWERYNESLKRYYDVRTFSPCPGQFAVMFYDITDRKQDEEALRLMSLYLDNASDSMFVLDLDGKLIYANERAWKTRGYTREELLGMDLRALNTPESAANIEATKKVLMAEGQAVFEATHRCKDGSPLPIEVSARIIETNGRKLIFSSTRDITERKQTESVLIAAKTIAETANTSKSRFLAAASHDLRQPMHAIGLFTDALRRTRLDPEQLRITLNLDASQMALGELLDALLDISRLDAGIVKQQPALVDVFDIFHRLESEFAQLLNEKKLRFLLRFPQKLTLFRTDPNLLLGILRNLISNALRYTDHGGILVGARMRRDHLLFQVWDTGIGIPNDQLASIFEEFYQVGNIERDHSKGLGLGLSIVHRLAQLMGYEISCRSTPGQGSVFTVKIPFDGTNAVTRTDSAAPRNLDATDDSTLKGLQVVLIEDNALVAEAWGWWLNSLEANAAIFPDAKQALASPAIETADIYISDLRLPGDMNGIELLNAIQDRVQRKIGGILVTGDTSSQQLHDLESAGWRVLHKPVETQTLLSAILSQKTPGRPGTKA